MNYRRKGTAFYTGYDETARFRYEVVNTSHTRGLDYYYYQPGANRFLKHFTMQLRLEGVLAQQLNYPEGCMAPTRIAPGAATVLE